MSQSACRAEKNVTILQPCNKEKSHGAIINRALQWRLISHPPETDSHVSHFFDPSIERWIVLPEQS
jgi:hypothetical protein